MPTASIFLSLVFSAPVVKAVLLPLPHAGLVKPVVALVDAKTSDFTNAVESLVGITNHTIHTVDHLEGSLGHTAGQLGSSLSHYVDGVPGEIEYLSGGLLGVLGTSHAHSQDNVGGLLDLWSDFEEKPDSSTPGDKSDSQR